MLCMAFLQMEKRFQSVPINGGSDDTYIGACSLGIPGHCPGYFDSSVLISRGPDAKAHGHQYIAYACTDIQKSAQWTDEIPFPQLRIKCGVAKSCPGTHTALQGTYGHIQSCTTTQFAGGSKKYFGICHAELNTKRIRDQPEKLNCVYGLLQCKSFSGTVGKSI